MHPDVGAIIGISLAASVLVVGLLFLCLMHMRCLPCCKSGILPPTAGNISRRTTRPSTSSRTPFTNFDLNGSSRNIDQLSALDLHHQNIQNPAHFFNATGIGNPLWQMHCTCHSSGILTASQQSLNCAHCHSINACHFHRHSQAQHMNQASFVETDHSSFQFFSPQLHSHSESPPPYPGYIPDVTIESSHRPSTNVDPETINSNPPQYSPKHGN